MKESTVRRSVSRSWVRIPSLSPIVVDVRARVANIHVSKPTEPLCPFWDMTLNSGGFFLSRSRQGISEGSRR